MTNLNTALQTITTEIARILKFNVIDIGNFKINVGVILARPLILLIIRLFFKFYSQF